MALPSSGTITLNQMHTEVGGASGTQASINDSDIRALPNKSSGAQMSFNEWYGTLYNQRNLTFNCGDVTWTPSGSKFATNLRGWDPAGYFLAGAPVSSLGSGSPQFIRYNGNRIIRVLACVQTFTIIKYIQFIFDSVSPALPTPLNTSTNMSTVLSLPSGFLTYGSNIRYQMGSTSFLGYDGGTTTRFRSILNASDPNFNAGAGTLPASGSVTLTFS